MPPADSATCHLFRQPFRGSSSLTHPAASRTISPVMAEPTEPPPVKLICGMISARKAVLDAALRSLTEIFGGTDIISEDMDFDFTHYYDADMGSPLLRRFVAFARLIRPDALVEAKVATNAIERRLVAAPPQGDGPPATRPVNLDPGYVESSKLVLASMKNFSTASTRTRRLCRGHIDVPQGPMGRPALDVSGLRLGPIRRLSDGRAGRPAPQPRGRTP